MSNAIEGLAASMADHLESRADALVEEWIDWIEDRVESPAVRGLPRRAIRDHMPPVLRGIARSLRAPVEGLRAEMIGHLELHANLRRGQGYSLDDLLDEHDILARMVVRSMREFFEANPGNHTEADVIAAFDRLETSLRVVGFATIRAFRERENEERRRLSERLEEFARTIAHELRSPLQAASLGVQLIRDATDPDQTRHQIEVVEKALQRTADLIDNLRELAVVEAGRGRQMGLGRVQRLVQEALEEVGPLARQRDVNIAIDGDVPDVAVDAVTFQQALVNIATNAVKYSDPDKPERYVTVSFDRHPVAGDMDRLVVRVVDNGLGIGPEYLHRVFQRKVRVHPGAAEGTGLGLSISRQLILERGGEIDLQSEPGVGTTVTFELPCHPGAVS